MHPSELSSKFPSKIALAMAETGETLTFKEWDDLSMRASQLFRSLGLERGDHVAILMENDISFLPICFGAKRSGLFFTAISYRLQEEEVEYIVSDCQAKVFVTSINQTSVVEKLNLANCEKKLMVGGTIPGFESWENLISKQPAEKIEDESNGMQMLYSSGTTGMPKGVLRPLPDGPYDSGAEGPNLIAALYGVTDQSIYLTPAPLYHSAPLTFTMAMMSMGTGCVVMKQFDPEKALATIEKYSVTHSQWVPTMFVRMLKLDERVRSKYNLSSLECAIHAAAPCPIPIKQQMIDWWGPCINEYYAGTEGNGFVAISSEQWLSHKGSVGQPLTAQLHIVDEDGNEVGVGESGTVYFEGGGEFEYFNDKEKTSDSRHAKGWSTLGDIGYLDEEGYLYLTDRKSFMIISGGVNIYPQETENLLVTHPRVMDVAVFGVPNEEFGEEVKAVIQPVNWDDVGDELANELIDFCRDNISHIKCPKSIDFEKELPRHPTGKLYKRILKDKYWLGHETKIL